MKRSTTTKKGPKKLVLGKERVRELTHQDLERASGGFDGFSATVDYTNQTQLCATTAA